MQEVLCLKTVSPCLQKPHPGTAVIDMAEIIKRKKVLEKKSTGQALSLKETLNLMPGQKDMSLRKNTRSSHRGH